MNRETNPRSRAARTGRLVRLAAGALACLLHVPAGHGAEAYPARPIRFIVSFPAGGSADILARSIAAPMSEALGQQLVLDNRAGAGGNIAADLTAKAAPDGYTILMGGTGAHAVNASLAKLPYDPIRDFAPVSNGAHMANVLAVHPSVAARSVQELIALARAKPRQLLYGSGGIGTSLHLAAELFKRSANVDIVHVPYKGGGIALIDVIAGQVHMVFAVIPTALSNVRAGKVRPLAVTSTTRSIALPELPTMAEAGVPGYSATLWFGVLAPAKTPPAIVDRLHREIVRALAIPEVRERLIGQGFEPVGDTPAQFRAFIESEIRKWAQVIRDSGTRAE